MVFVPGVALALIIACRNETVLLRSFLGSSLYGPAQMPQCKWASTAADKLLPTKQVRGAALLKKADCQMSRKQKMNWQEIAHFLGRLCRI
jgi:hypothetical protein